MKTLKLYVWENVLEDWDTGIMVALAYSLKQARELLLDADKYGQVKNCISKPHIIVKKPKCFIKYGGA